MNQTVCPGPAGAVAFPRALILRDSFVSSRIQPVPPAQMPARADVADRDWAATFAAPAAAMAAIGVPPALVQERS